MGKVCDSKIRRGWSQEYAHYATYCMRTIFRFMSEEQAAFDWSPLGEPWWRDAVAGCKHKPSEMQLRFAVGRRDGLTATDAARRAGYTGAGERLRQAGSRADKSTAVKELLAFAYLETGIGPDGTVKAAESKRIVSRIARTGNNSERLKACEFLDKAEQRERELDPTAGRTERDAIKDLLEHRHGVGFAALTYLGAIENHGRRVNLAGLPLFRECAPSIAAEYPQLWEAIRNHLDQECRDEADAMAAAAVALPIDRLSLKTTPSTIESFDADQSA
jgi:hypothetical protein